MKEYIGTDVVAAELGVSTAVIATWFLREIPGVPKPVAIVRHMRMTHRLWEESSIPEWKEWYRNWKLGSAEFQLARAEAELKKARERLDQIKAS